MNQMKIYLIVSIDTECDKGWRVRQPLQFKNILEGIPKRLQPLFEKYNIKPTYLLSPEVLINDACVDLFKSLNGSVEFGTHLHAEFIEPDLQLNAEYTNSSQSELSSEIEFEKLKNLTDLFKKKMQYFPKSFRAGRFGLSRYTLRFLINLGYCVDSSVTPFRWRWREKGNGENYLGAPYQPYYPSLDDIRKPGKMKLLEVPISIVNPFWDNFPQYLLCSFNPLNKFQAFIINKLFHNNLRLLWLRPTYSSPEQMLYISEYICQKAKKRDVFLCMMFHSNEATPGMSPYNSFIEDVRDFINQLECYFKILFKNYDVMPITLSETTRFWLG